MAVKVLMLGIMVYSMLITIASGVVITHPFDKAWVHPAWMLSAVLSAFSLSQSMALFMHFAQPLALRDIRAKLAPWIPLSPDLSPMWLASFEDSEYVVRLDTYWEVVFTSTQNVQGAAHYERWEAMRDLLRAGHDIRPVLQLVYGATVLDIRELTTGEAAP
jgi:hypothetical protein